MKKSLVLLFVKCLVLSSIIGQNTIYLMGDAGNVKEGNAVELFARTENQQSKDDVLIFLGDNIYFRGLPDEDSDDRALAESRLLKSLLPLKDFQGHIIFVPGNHDWDNSGKNGWRYILNEQNFIREYLHRSDVYFPSGGCPGPETLALSDEINLIFLDTQWWLHGFEKPGEGSDCDAKSSNDIIQQLDDFLSQNIDKNNIVIAHHPLVSVGAHAGIFTLKSNIFPLTVYAKNAYIPLPGLGTLYSAYSKVGGTPQDFPHPLNKKMRHNINDVLKKYPNTIYASGHDHSLQYHVKDSVHYIVSGSTSYQTAVNADKHTKYAASVDGYAKLQISQSGRKLVFKTLGEDSPIFDIPKPKRVPETFVSSNKLDEPTTVLAADASLADNNAIRRKILGASYRYEWTIPVQAIGFDVDTMFGGLTPLKRGGGRQTTTLRLVDKNGKEYVLRSLKKDTRPVLEGLFDGALLDAPLALYLVDDGVSGSHPFGFMAVPILAEAAQVPHAHPRLVAVGSNPKLGKYSPLYANTLNLLEERNPLEEKYGKTVNTLDLERKIQANNHHRIVEKEVLRARLFDALIGDWDRHKDQFRWYEVTKGKDHFYSPIPRDRDQAFFYNDGWLAKIVGRDFAMPRVQGYQSKYRNFTSFMEGSEDFDRTFLTALSKEEWVAMATDIQQKVTDEVIDAALAEIPKEVQGNRNAKLRQNLISNRDLLPEYAKQYYLFLAKNAVIKASDEAENVAIYRRTNDTTVVNIFNRKKDGSNGDKLFDRTFIASETKSINIFAMGGKDVITLSGKVDNGIAIRIIGGKGQDTIDDQSLILGSHKDKLLVYDMVKNITIKNGDHVDVKLTKDPEVHLFHPMEFNASTYYIYPTINLADRVDGPNVGLVRNYRAPVFQSKKGQFSTMFVRYLFNFNGLSAGYNYLWHSDYDKKAWNFSAKYNRHAYINSFYGFGNETKADSIVDYYQIRNSSFEVGLTYRKSWKKNSSFYIGPKYFGVKFEAPEHSYLENFNQNGLPAEILNFQNFGVLTAGIEIDKRNKPSNPAYGTYFSLRNATFLELSFSKKIVNTINADWSLFWSNSLPASITIAQRFGIGYSSPNFDLFQSQFLSGPTNLRGYFNNRFAGNTVAFSNTDIRLPLMTVPTAIIPFKLGIYGYFDIGKVNFHRLETLGWHTSKGLGLFFSPLDMGVLTLTYHVSDDLKKESFFKHLQWRFGWQF